MAYTSQAFFFEVDTRMVFYLLTMENITTAWPGNTRESLIDTILPCRQTSVRSFIMVRNHRKKYNGTRKEMCIFSLFFP